MSLKEIYLFLFLVSSAFHGWSQKIYFSGNDFNSIFICEDERVYCSGQNDAGQLGNGTSLASNIPVQIAGIGGMGTPPKCKQVQIEGVSSYIALTNSGDTVIAWGVNTHGQIGDGTIVGKSYPVRVAGIGGNGYLKNIKQVATGNFSSYALDEDGKVLNWGYNFYGQLGNGSFGADVLYPDYVLKGPGDTLKNVQMISAGGVSCMALLCDGTVWVWGRNDRGQLGQGNITNSAYAIQVKNSTGTSYLSNIKTIESGDNYCFALSNADTLWGWGLNANGQLGIGNNASTRTLPVYTRTISGTSSLTGVIDVAAGQGHTMALLSDNTVLAWGKNTSGQLGNNSVVNTNLPVQVLDASGLNPLTGINYIVTGDLFSIVRNSANQLYVWGENAAGQLGLGDNTTRILPSLLTLPCEPTSDVLPNYGQLISPPRVCSGTNTGNVYIHKHQSAISNWQQSTDNFSSFSTIPVKDFSISFTNLLQPTYFRAVLTECGNNSYSPAAIIEVDSVSVGGTIYAPATVRLGHNKDTLLLSGYVGLIIRWEYSKNHFGSDITQIQNTSNSQIYENLLNTTYYRALVQYGICPLSYSDEVEIRTIDASDVKIYNSFTPNGDHYNDEWIIDLIEFFPNNKVEIYNRWGQLVYKADHYDNINKVWKGESNVSGTPGGSMLADGTFFYLVDLGENYSIQKGYVVISR